MPSAASGEGEVRSGLITTALGEGALFLEGFTASERLSEPFTIACEVVSPTKVDFSSYLGSGVSITVNGGALSGRDFHGLMIEASQLDAAGGSVRYLLVLRPWLWVLSLGRNSRIFQAMSARDIIGKVFSDAAISNDLFQLKLSQAGTVTRNYCVQYEESDFDFVSRLMEEEGIYYYFTHSSDRHVLTLCDGPSSHSDFAGGDLPLNRTISEGGWAGAHLWRWGDHVRPTPTKVGLRDVHLMRWTDTLEATNASTSSSNVSAEVFHYPGGYSHLTDDGQTAGTNFAQLRLQAARAEQTRYIGEGDTFAVALGAFATVSPVSGDAEDASVKVFVTAATHTFSGQFFSSGDASDDLSTTVVIEGVPSAVTWRPALRTPRPTARGPQIAMVVGRSGEVIDPDAYGRVRVQFPWDRAGQQNETSSCWVRVSQSWADAGFGHMHIPRIGEEVIVDFFDGDMDRPIITGRVFNSTKTPPYTLPDEKTKSTWKSQTVGASGQYPDTVDPPPSSSKGFNEIRFEDKGGSEEVFVHAQRLYTGWYRFDETRTTGHNTTITVGYNRTISIKNDESKTVQEGDETHTISKGSLTTEVTQGDETRKVVAGKRTTTISQTDSLEVQSGDLVTKVDAGKRTTTIMGDDALTVETGNYSATISVGSVSVTSPQKITLAVGATSIELTPEGITLAGPMITIQADAVAKLESAMVQVNGSAMVQVQGALVMIN